MRSQSDQTRSGPLQGPAQHRQTAPPRWSQCDERSEGQGRTHATVKVVHPCEKGRGERRAGGWGRGESQKRRAIWEHDASRGGLPFSCQGVTSRGGLGKPPFFSFLLNLLPPFLLATFLTLRFPSSPPARVVVRRGRGLCSAVSPTVSTSNPAPPVPVCSLESFLDLRVFYI